MTTPNQSGGTGAVMEAKMELTDKQRAVLNEAEQILVSIIRHKNEVLMLSLHAGWERFSTTYFTPNEVQHGGIWVSDKPGFAAKVDRIMEIRAEEDGRADDIRAERIERLRAELASLTGEAA